MIQHVHARPSTTLPAGNPPAHIMWMPPGKQTVQPMGFDVPFTMDVDANLAAQADQQLQKLRSLAAAGQGPHPFIDANHKDEARMAKALRFWWGGNDPRNGGVRLDLEWTGAGASVVRGGSLPCLSPSWILNKVTKAFLGITANVGGLVTASAFQTMQVFCKAGSASGDPFRDRVQQVMKEEGVSEEMAWSFVLKNEPELWRAHFLLVLGLTEEQVARFDIPLVCDAVAKYVSPETHDQMMRVARSKFGGQTGAVVEPEPSNPPSNLDALVRARMAEAGSDDYCAAAQHVTAKNPSLYAQYREALIRR